MHDTVPNDFEELFLKRATSHVTTLGEKRRMLIRLLIGVNWIGFGGCSGFSLLQILSPATMLLVRDS